MRRAYRLWRLSTDGRSWGRQFLRLFGPSSPPAGIRERSNVRSLASSKYPSYLTPDGEALFGILTSGGLNSAVNLNRAIGRSG